MKAIVERCYLDQVLLDDPRQTVVVSSAASSEAFGRPAVAPVTIVKPRSINSTENFPFLTITTSYTIDIGGLKLPTGHTESTAWTNEAYAYDDDKSTYALETVS